MIFYTEDKRRQDREWVVEGVVGDKTSAEIRQLNPDTKYFFKIQVIWLYNDNNEYSVIWLF